MKTNGIAPDDLSHSTESETNPLSAALAYAAAGWPVLPLHTPDTAGGCSCLRECGTAGKHPHTINGVKDATTNAARITKWWEMWPEANIGIATGGDAGIIVLDVDPRHGGNESLAMLEREYGPLPETRQAVTGGGGRHLLFAYPGGTIRNSAGKVGPGLDIRGDGGYIVGAPSLHASGSRYRWVDGAPIAPLPDWLAHGATAEERGSTSTNSDGKPIPEGSRNATLASIAGTMRHRGLQADEILPALRAFNERRCAPPLAAEEVERIAHSVSRYAPGAADSGPAGDGQLAEVAPWPPLAEFHEPPLPSFPTSALPGWLRDFVEGVATATQTPVDLTAMLALATIATSAAGKVEVRARDGWVEPVNIFVTVAQPPGTRKSAVFRHVTEPLEQFERERAEEMNGEIEKAQDDIDILNERIAEAKRRVAKGDGDVATEDVRRLREELTELVANKPVKTRFLADDVTPEKLKSLLAEQKGRLGVLSPEGEIFEQMAGRYSSGAPNFDVFLRGHAGDALRVDRASRSEFIGRPALTLGLAVQPDVIRGLAARPGFRGRGLLGRFLYSMPPSTLGTRRPGAPPVPPSVRAAYAARVKGLAAMRPDGDEDGTEKPRLLRLSGAADERLRRFEEELEPRLSEDGDLGNMSDWAGKLAGAVVRLAGILHLATVVERAEWPAEIQIETLDRAVTIAGYLTAHARAAYAEMGADERVEAAKFVLRWVKKWKGAGNGLIFSKQDVWQGTKGRFKQVSAMEPALAVLKEHGYIRPLAWEESGRRGRKAGGFYEINPQLAPYNSYNSYNSPPKDNSRDSRKCRNEVEVEVPESFLPEEADPGTAATRSWGEV